MRIYGGNRKSETREGERVDYKQDRILHQSGELQWPPNPMAGLLQRVLIVIPVSIAEVERFHRYRFRLFYSEGWESCFHSKQQ